MDYSLAKEERMKVIGIAAISINGMIAQRPLQQSLDWTSGEDTEHFRRITKKAGVLIVGRKTYELIGKPLQDRLMIVLTKTPERFDARDGVTFTDRDPKEVLADLKREGQEAVAVIGGQEIYSQFLQEKLLTDLYVTVEPVLFGNGVNLSVDFDRIDVYLQSVEKLGDASVLLHYTF